MVGILMPAFSQKISETTIKRFSVGADINQDFWLNKPDSMDVRGINQGGGAFGMYNFPFGKSNFSFAIGIGITVHNLFSNTTIADIKADTIKFVPIPDTVNYKKSKLGLTYLEIPVEFRLKTKDKVRVCVGFKIGYLLDAKTKYKGDREDGKEVKIKEKPVNNVEKWQFGPVIRVGYDWFNISAYYSVTQIFRKERGPEVSPISVGITLMPF